MPEEEIDRDRIYKDFVEEFSGHERIGPYIGGIGLGKDEGRKSYTLRVTLTKPLPDDIKLPTDYKGLPVVIEDFYGRWVLLTPREGAPR